MKLARNKKKTLLKNSKVKGRELAEIKNEKELAKKYGVLFTFSRDAIMILEPPSWKFTSGNFAAIKLFKIKYEKELLSLGIVDLSPEKQPDGKLSSMEAKKMIEKAIKEGSNLFEWTFKKKGEENFPATILLSRVEEKEKTYLEATIRDITEQKKAEKEMKIFNEAAIERELKMIELKKRIKELENKLNEGNYKEKKIEKGKK